MIVAGKNTVRKKLVSHGGNNIQFWIFFFWVVSVRLVWPWIRVGLWFLYKPEAAHVRVAALLFLSDTGCGRYTKGISIIFMALEAKIHSWSTDCTHSFHCFIVLLPHIKALWLSQDHRLWLVLCNTSLLREEMGHRHHQERKYNWVGVAPTVESVSKSTSKRWP